MSLNRHHNQHYVNLSDGHSHRKSNDGCRLRLDCHIACCIYATDTDEFKQNYYQNSNQTVTIKALPSMHPIHLPARQLVANIHFLKFLARVVY